MKIPVSLPRCTEVLDVLASVHKASGLSKSGSATRSFRMWWVNNHYSVRFREGFHKLPYIHQLHQLHLSLCFPFRERDTLSSWGLQSEAMQTPRQCWLIRLPSQRTPLALHAEQSPGDLWPLASHGVLILPSASGSTAVAAEGSVLGPQLGSLVPAGPPRQPSSRDPEPDTDVAVQQLKGRAARGATFEAMPISGLKMYGTLVKLSSFHGAIATDLGLGRG